MNKPLPESGIETFDRSLGAAIGCTNKCSYCYARGMAKRFAKRFERPADAKFSDITYHQDKLMRLNGSPDGKSYFVCPLSDVFCKGFLQTYRSLMFWLMAAHPLKRFYLQTKSPENITEMDVKNIPPNCVMGVSVTSPSDLVRANILAGKPFNSGVGLYISFEPLLEIVFVDKPIQGIFDEQGTVKAFSEGCFKWIIVGPQTNPLRQPPIEAVQQIRRLAEGYGVPLWEKSKLDVGLKLIQQFPPELRVREMPNV